MSAADVPPSSYEEVADPGPSSVLLPSVGTPCAMVERGPQMVAPGKIVSPEFQLEFLTKLQRLLAEGEFVASYKFALLLSLADLAVEDGDDGGGPQRIRIDDIARKFVAYYWRQARPRTDGGANTVLRQNTGGQAEVLSLLAKRKHSSPSDVLRDGRVVGRVAWIVKRYPLWKLQTLGHAKVEFLYKERIDGGCIELLPGVAFCLRRFHRLIHDLVRGAWLGFVRRLPANKDLVGEGSDLAAFMFGPAERGDLGPFVPILRDLQKGGCFYCRKPVGKKAAVDHFVPWSMYPLDLGHNFVLTDQGCNSAKSDTLAGLAHLERWWRRLEDHGPTLAKHFGEGGLVHDEKASKMITTWAYDAAARAGAQAWSAGKHYELLPLSWRGRIAVSSP